MPTHTEDVISGARFSLKGNIERLFTVKGLNPSRPGSLRLMDAVDYLGVYIGQGHPTRPGYVVDDAVPMPLANSKTTVRVTVSYAKVDASPGEGGMTDQQFLDAGGTLIRTTSTVSMVTTQMDYAGNPIRVVYVAGRPPGFKPDPNFRDPSKNPKDHLMQTREAQKPESSRMIEFVRMELSSPWNKNLIFCDTLNQKPIWGDGQHTFLCHGITESYNYLDSAPKRRPGVAAPRDRHEVRYLFEHKKHALRGGPGFDALNLYVSPQTGQVPGDINPRAGGWPRERTGNGWSYDRLLEDRDFAVLNLPDFTKL